jgi:two-component system, LuxR family, sensor kinase FixL
MIVGSRDRIAGSHMPMIRLETFLSYAESHRLTVCAIAAAMITAIAWTDARLPMMSLGFLYLFPILVSAPALDKFQIIALAALCGFLREAFDPLMWSPGATGRFLTATSGFATTGFLVVVLNERRRLLGRHLSELESEVHRREDAESQVRTLIDTSPLAILIMDHSGRLLLANESAHRLLDFDTGSMRGMNLTPFLPILPRMLQRHPEGSLRTNVECQAKRRNGEVFLAHVWLSTFQSSLGRGLAAVIWDASENLRDREGAGLDSMMATSRILVGAISHEIRNLAAAAATSFATLPTPNGLSATEPYRALGSLIQALERIATSGLNMAAQREGAIADLGTVLYEMRVVIDPMLLDADITVTWQIDENLPPVQAEQRSLLQVFINLARNIRCVLSQSPCREVRISAKLETDLVAVRLYDSGPGVAQPDELFKPFQGGAHSSGLGLYISRAILRSYGGNLRYEPQPEGCCFVVELWPVEKHVETY